MLQLNLCACVSFLTAWVPRALYICGVRLELVRSRLQGSMEALSSPRAPAFLVRRVFGFCSCWLPTCSLVRSPTFRAEESHALPAHCHPGAPRPYTPNPMYPETESRNPILSTDMAWAPSSGCGYMPAQDPGRSRTRRRQRASSSRTVCAIWAQAEDLKFFDTMGQCLGLGFRGLGLRA